MEGLPDIKSRSGSNSSPSTLRSWTGSLASTLSVMTPTAELTGLSEDEDLFNKSETEALGRGKNPPGELNLTGASPMSNDSVVEVLSSSMMSGIAKLSVTVGENDGEPWPEFQHLGDDEILDYPHNDSVEVFLSKECNESQIVTVEDSRQNTVNESILEGPTNPEEIRAEFPEGFLDEDLNKVGKNLTKFK